MAECPTCKQEVSPETFKQLVDLHVQPPAGEVERLQERLYEQATKDRLQALLQDEGWTYLTPNSIHNVLDMVARAAFPAPSDSQGDQRCYGNGWIDTGHEVKKCRGCPDCNTAPTQVEGDDREPNADEWCCDSCGLIAPEESEGWEQRGPDDAGVTVEFCPEHRLTCKNCDGAGVYIQPATPAEGEHDEECWECKGTGKRQPEGGDVEDWPEAPSEVWLNCFTDLPLEWWANPSTTGSPEDIAGKPLHGCRYVPASQDSSGLKEAETMRRKAEADAQLCRTDAARWEDRANKAEAALAKKPAWADVPPTRFSAWGQEEHNRAERYENALEELVAKFEDLAKRSRVDAYAVVASLVREKAAELKGGGS